MQTSQSGIPDGSTLHTVFGAEYVVNNKNTKTPGYIGVEQEVKFGYDRLGYEFPVLWVKTVTPAAETRNTQEYNKDLLELGVKHDLEIYFVYRKPDGVQSDRCILPTGVGNELVYGKDRYDDDAIKAFRLDRIVDEVWI